MSEEDRRKARHKMEMKRKGKKMEDDQERSSSVAGGKNGSKDGESPPSKTDEQDFEADSLSQGQLMRDMRK